MIVTIKVDERTRHALRYIAAVMDTQQQQAIDKLVQDEAKRLGWHFQTSKSEEQKSDESGMKREE